MCSTANDQAYSRRWRCNQWWNNRRATKIGELQGYGKSHGAQWWVLFPFLAHNLCRGGRPITLHVPWYIPLDLREYRRKGCHDQCLLLGTGWESAQCAAMQDSGRSKYLTERPLIILHENVSMNWSWCSSESSEWCVVATLKTVWAAWDHIFAQYSIPFAWLFCLDLFYFLLILRHDLPHRKITSSCRLSRWLYFPMRLITLVVCNTLKSNPPQTYSVSTQKLYKVWIVSVFFLVKWSFEHDFFLTCYDGWSPSITSGCDSHLSYIQPCRCLHNKRLMVAEFYILPYESGDALHWKPIRVSGSALSTKSTSLFTHRRERIALIYTLWSGYSIAMQL